MSDAAVPSHESTSAAARVTKPLSMVHSDQCAIPDPARRPLPPTHVQAVVSVVKPGTLAPDEVRARRSDPQ
jgi:hypothetical protein